MKKEVFRWQLITATSTIGMQITTVGWLGGNGWPFQKYRG